MRKAGIILLLIISDLAIAVSSNNLTPFFIGSGDSEMGHCHSLNRIYDTISLVDNEYKKHDNFEFVINTKDLISVKADISDEQLINIRRQLVTAHSIYQTSLGLTSPLKKQRYKKAHAIRVIMAPIKNNGLSFDEVITDHNTNKCYVAIKIKSTLKHTNVTPAHELFHIYQSSYFMFKNKWLTEGTAQWSEYLLNEGSAKKTITSLPQTRTELETVLKLSYDASAMWARLFQLIDNQSTLQIPHHIKKNLYTDNEYIIKDSRAYGTNFIQILFESLEEQSKQAANDKGLSIYNWKEADQKSPTNNPYIWQAVQNAINKALPKEQQSEELKKFMSISLS